MGFFYSLVSLFKYMKSVNLKVLLVFEIILLFAPVTTFASIGLVFSYVFFIKNFQVTDFELFFVAMLPIFGFVGLLGVLQLLLKILFPESIRLFAKSVIVELVFGVIPIFVYLIILAISSRELEAGFLAMLLAPLIGLIHLLLLGRQYFDFTRSEKLGSKHSFLRSEKQGA